MNESLLKNIPLFASLDNKALRDLAGTLKKEVRPAHQVIFWMNEKGDQLYIVQKGNVQISYTDDDGKEAILAVLGPGSFFGELSLIDGGPHTATARTVNETTLLTLDRPAFYHFLNEHPQLSHLMMEELSLRLRSNTVRIRGVINVNERLEEKHSSYQHFIDRVAKVLTSSSFVLFYLLFIIGWISVQVYHYKTLHPGAIRFADTPPTFFILGFFITLTSFVLTVLILNSQRRQAENDRIRGEIEYQVNVKAQSEIMKLQLKMDQLVDAVSRLTNEKGTREQTEDEY